MLHMTVYVGVEHLQAFVSQGSPVESFLVARLQLQGRVTVLLGLFKATQSQEANSSEEEEQRGRESGKTGVR